jgi:YHS domain-containing protein
MVRDPACGKYLPRRGALSERVKGEALHFCSDECREAFARGVRAMP